MNQKRVLIIMGSEGDVPIMEEVANALSLLQVGHEMHIASAHRTPDRVSKLAREAKDQGFGVIVAGAGLSAHLPGVVAAHTTLPVIGVPLPSGAMNGVDSLISMVQMPRGIPVATVAIGASGAYNAGLLAAAILAIEDLALSARLDGMRLEMAQKVEQSDQALQRRS
jgi:5-(carboxyamino)imidazole ribonucleotide mutase